MLKYKEHFQFTGQATQTDMKEKWLLLYLLPHHSIFDILRFLFCQVYVLNCQI